MITHDKIQSVGDHQLIGELHRLWIQVRRWR